MNLTLTEHELLTDNVWSFRFKPEEPLTWSAGQFIQVELPHASPDAEGTKRWFTVSAAPHENFIQITTRITTSTFKQALAALPIGDKLKLLAKPDGDFVWEETKHPRVFIAGGIGITPFRSILASRSHDHKPLELTLVYTGRTLDLPFKDELARIAQANPKFAVHYVIGERLTPANLANLVPNFNNSLVYLSGPEPMVESLGDALKAAGLPEAQLKQDFFPNYTEKNY